MKAFEARLNPLMTSLKFLAFFAHYWQLASSIAWTSKRTFASGLAYCPTTHLHRYQYPIGRKRDRRGRWQKVGHRLPFTHAFHGAAWDSLRCALRCQDPEQTLG